MSGRWQEELAKLTHPGEVVTIAVQPEDMPHVQSAIRKAGESLGMKVATKKLSRRTLSYWRLPFGTSEDLREEK